MKIAHFISSPAAGGAEVYVKDLAISMAKLGHELSVIFLFDSTDFNRNLEFRSKFIEDLQKNSVKFYFIGVRARRNPLFGYFKIRKILKIINPEVLHCHLYYAALYALITAPFSTKLIYTHHSIVLGAPKFIYSLLDVRFKNYIAICKACLILLSSVTKNRVTQINNAVDHDKLKSKVLKKLPVGDFIKIISVGRLTEAKNYPLLIESLNYISHLNFKLYIAGEGPDFESIKLMVNNSGLEKKVIFLGNVSNLNEIYSNYDIFAMSSSWEGLPISLLEATIVGLPCVVTDVGGCSEVVMNCQNGIVVESLNPHDYSEALKTLIESYDFRLSCMNNSHKYSNVYKIEISRDMHLSLYTTVLSNI